jgi:CDGSH-type Zn-finger protein
MEDAKKVEIMAFENGPYMVKGKFRLIDSKGNEISVTDPTYFCRCGHSKIKPFCDGQHKNLGWKE